MNNKPTYKKTFFKKEKHIINSRIRSNELRIIDDAGENLGIMSTNKALDLAHSKDLDLVVVAENANPPVAKILDYRKFLYTENRKEAAAKAKSKKSELKELRITPRIADGDLEKRIERAKEFLSEGNRVKISVVLKGREKANPQFGFDKIQRVLDSTEEIAKTESEPKFERGGISVVLLKK